MSGTRFRWKEILVGDKGERTKEATKRDWEQTKADVSEYGQEKDQDFDSTVRQASGKKPVPPEGAPNRD